MIPPVLTWVPGMRLAQYTLVHELARGGMGEIWLARQAIAGGITRHVVIKRLIASGDEDPAAVSMFLDEARIVSQLSHPNVVQVFDFAQHDQSYYLVMEYLPGETLSRTMRAARDANLAIDPSLCAMVIAQAAAGLGSAHTHHAPDGTPLNIVHRDVSPQNLLLTYDGHVKVLDFGIASAEGKLSKTSTGTVKGRLAYMSPQHAAAQKVDATADVFSLGVVLFELLTGRRLHSSTEDVAVFRRLADRRPFDGPAKFASGISPQLDAITRRALAFEPEDRFANGRELADALAATLRGESELQGRLKKVMHALFKERIAAQRKLMAVAASLQGERGDLPSPTTNPSMPGGLSSARVALPPGARSNRLGVALLLGGLLAGGVAAALWLMPRDARLSVVANPDNALVDIDGDACPAPCERELSTGDHTVSAQLDGHRKASQKLTLSAGEVRTVVLLLAKEAPAPEPVPVAVPAPVQPVEPEPDAGVVAPAPPPAKAPTGLLTLDTTPWTKVFIGRRQLGETPLVKVPVPAGRVRLRLINELENIDRVVDVEVGAGVTVKKISL